MSPPSASVTAESVSVSFGSRPALESLTFELARGSSAQRLLLDDPDVGLAGSSHEQAFYQRLRSELPELGWQLRQRESGWMVYARDRRE